MQNYKPAVGTPIANISLPTVGGGTMTVGGKRERHQFFVVYRGKHCPRCKRHLNKLQKMLPEFEEAGIDVLVASADPIDKSLADQDEFGWEFDLAYDLREDQMRELGVYVTDPISPNETDRRFAEPASFFILPDGTTQIVILSNGPAARPDLEELLDGMKFNISNNRPTRGMA